MDRLGPLGVPSSTRPCPNSSESDPMLATGRVMTKQALSSVADVLSRAGAAPAPEGIGSIRVVFRVDATQKGPILRSVVHNCVPADSCSLNWWAATGQRFEGRLFAGLSG